MRRLWLSTFLQLALVILFGVLGLLPSVASGATPALPLVSAISFSAGFDEEAEVPLDSADSFEYGITVLYASYVYEDAPRGQSYDYAWYLDGEEIQSGTGEFENEYGASWHHLFRTDGEPVEVGTYWFVMHIDGETIAEGEAVVVEPGAKEEVIVDEPTVEAEVTDGQGALYSTVTFATSIDEQAELPVDAGNRFSYGITRLYAYWTYHDLPADQNYGFTWYHDGEVLLVSEGSLSAGSGANWVDLKYDLGTPLVPGRYAIAVTVDGETVLNADCLVFSPSSPAYGPVLFSVEFDRDIEEPIDPRVSFPPGAVTLYGYWPYAGVTPGTKYVVTWWKDDEFFGSSEDVFEFEYGNLTYSAFEDDGGALKPGVYRLNITVGDELVLSARAVIEGQSAAADQSSFGPLTFSSGFDDQSQRPVNVGTRFESGVTHLYAFFDYAGAKHGSSYTWRWFVDGELANEGNVVLTSDAASAWVWRSNPNGAPLAPGVYKIEIVYDSKVVLTGETTIGEATSSPTEPKLGPLTFSSGLDDRTQQPIDAGTRFPAGTIRLFASFPFEGVTPGAAFAWEWQHDGQTTTSGEVALNDASGSAWVRRAEEDGSPLPVGLYRIRISYDGKVMLEGEVRISAGRRPPPSTRSK